MSLQIPEWSLARIDGTLPFLVQYRTFYTITCVPQRRHSMPYNELSSGCELSGQSDDHVFTFHHTFRQALGPSFFYAPGFRFI